MAMHINVMRELRATTVNRAHPGADFAKLRLKFFDSGPSLWSQPLMLSFRRIFVVAFAILVPVACASDNTPTITPVVSADIEHGKATFNTMCSVCHSVQKSGGPSEGPNLLGLVGREAGSQPDFTKYSDALKASGHTWNTQNLDKFLTSPMAMVPGTLMPMQIADDKTRADVIAYLATLKPEEASE